MFSDRLSDYVEGVAAKYLSAVDANPSASNQHEIGGLVRVGFKTYLGEPLAGERIRYRTRLVYIADPEEAPVICDDDLSWYGATRRDPTRKLEYRLYYPTNDVSELICEGDFCLIAKLRKGELLLVFSPRGGEVENQLRAIFGLQDVGQSFVAGDVAKASLVLPVRLLLEDIGLVVGGPQQGADQWLEKLHREFGGREFPSTSRFSAYARDSLENGFDPVANPDEALMAWMDHEEWLFRLYERHIVKEKLAAGFGSAGDDVDEFIGYSLSVQNRRKSRVGHALEGHLEAVFLANRLRFERGVGKNRITENNSKPDFLFPGFAEYRDPSFPESRLAMLGAKTTCKDRWRQVLAEARRIPRKHLITLEAAISERQTDEMADCQVQLVVPNQILQTYTPKQQTWLQDISLFIREVGERVVS